LLHATKALDLSVQGTFFEGGILPADRIEIGSDLWYARRKNQYRGMDAVVEARYLPSSGFNLIAGAETVYDHETMPVPERISKITDQPVASHTVTQRIGLLNVGAFVSSNLAIAQWLKLTGGLRYDNHSIYGGQLTGRVGVTSRQSKSLVFKVLYGNAFKAPSPYLLYAQPLMVGDVQGNDKLKPQKIHTAELQVSWKPNAVFGVTSSVSYNWLFDKAEFFRQGMNLVARNAASQQSLTWETRADLKHYDDLAAYLSMELVRSVRDLGQEGYAADLMGDRNVAYPWYIARGGVVIAIPSLPSLPLSVGTEAMLVGPRNGADTSTLNNGAPFALKPYPTVNAWVTTRDLYLLPGHESRIALRAYNLFAARGPDPGFSGFEYPLAPREIYLELMHTY
jgi:iron complex outermembrane receptor protein